MRPPYDVAPMILGNIPSPSPRSGTRAPADYRAAIALGATGLRIGEVLGLTADRVDLEHRLVTIDRQLQRIGNDDGAHDAEG